MFKAAPVQHFVAVIFYPRENILWLILWQMSMNCGQKPNCLGCVAWQNGQDTWLENKIFRVVAWTSSAKDQDLWSFVVAHQKAIICVKN